MALATAIALGLLFAPPARASGDEPAAPDRVQAILSEHERDPHLAALELSRLGPEAIPELFQALERCGPEPWPSRSLIEALGAQPRWSLDTWLASLARAAVPVGRRAVALRLLGALGDGESLPLQIELVLPPGGPLPAAPAAVPSLAPAADPSLIAALEQGLAAILTRERRAPAQVAMLFPRIPADLRTPVLRALGASRRPESADALASLLDFDPALELSLVTQIGRVGASVRKAAGGDARDALRLRLGSPDAALRRESALAVGRIGDDRALPRLIELLADADEGVQKSAHWSLVHLSGLGRSPRAESWQAWLEREEQWRETELPRLEDALAGPERGAAVAAIQEISRHRLGRDDLALGLAELLRESDPEILLATCAGLQELGSWETVPALAEVVDDRDPRVAEAAWKALQAITGRDLPAEVRPWREL